MTFAYTAHADAFHRSLEAAARQVAAFTNRVVGQMVRGFWAHDMGGGPPLGPVHKTARPDAARVAADRKRRKATRQLHARLRRSGRNKRGQRT